METVRPCARCERELPLSRFKRPDTPFCKTCEKEAAAIIRRKYNIIRAAHFRARLRHKTRQLRARHQVARSGSA